MLTCREPIAAIRPHSRSSLLPMMAECGRCKWRSRYAIPLLKDKISGKFDLATRAAIRTAKGKLRRAKP